MDNFVEIIIILSIVIVVIICIIYIIKYYRMTVLEHEINTELEQFIKNSKIDVLI